MRYDLKPEPYFFRALYDTVWINYGSSVGKLTDQQFRIDFGVKF